MLFNSYQFLLFFPIVTIIYFLLPHKYRWFHLLAASCIFYTAFIPIYIFILIFTIIIDYFAGILIENAKGKNRKLFLIMSIIANVGVLAVFKYYNFFIDNMNEMAASFHLKLDIPLLNIILPIGLSFHTFQAMSYTIEVYRQKQKAEKHFGIYSLYVMFYPQLVAGPIERPQNLLHQFREPHRFESDKLLSGLRLMLWGFFKKVVIADRLAVYVDTVYNDHPQYNAINLIIATLFYTIQIYCDFSGYSDIAIGAAKTMGFDLMINFKRPYFSKNIKEFWTKWHISLSTWFRDYLYISLGGNRVSLSRLYFNVMIVFLISGFWHGANWTFIAWGGLHAVYTMFYMLYDRQSLFKIPNNLISNFFSAIVTFCLVAFAWIFFRAASIQDAFIIIKNIITFDNNVPFQMIVRNAVNNTTFGISSMVISILMICILTIVEKRLDPVLSNMESKKSFVDIIFCSVILSLLIMFGVFHNTSFIYFQF